MKNKGCLVTIILFVIAIIFTAIDNSGQTTKTSSYSSSSFHNAYGTSTTICAHSGCTSYIASTGDTNCCTVHSNKCGECGKYIDEDAWMCMSCIKKLTASAANQAGRRCDNCSRTSTKILTIREPDGTETAYYVCDSCYSEFKTKFNGLKGYYAY